MRVKVFQRKELVQDLDNKYKALRLCCNLRSFSSGWVYIYLPNDDSNSTEISDNLDILLTLPVRTLPVRTRAGIAEKAWTRLTQFTRLQSSDVQSMNMECPLFPGRADNLRDSLTSCSWQLSGSRITRQDEELALLSALRNLRHVQIRRPNAFAFSVLEALPNLESMDTQYTATRTETSTRPFTASLEHLTIQTDVPIGSLAAHLWKLIMQLVPKCSLESFEIRTSTTRIGVTSDFVRELTEIHGATLKSFSVGYMYMDASDIAHLCKICPKLEYLACSVHALHYLYVTLDQYSLGDDPYIKTEVAKAWMLRESSRLRIIQIYEVFYEVSCAELSISVPT
ncbi:hypothetical protein EUX98_g6379 [Antrodiella citrinella]|uniref:F-box domain-containing protein n=1 Tax=Antrodiella citrinella TaxID=2447956 RepID=A0A4S4MRT3_9APHY|nr:hypothetical protein EUX98_g6379 [Antrodiella citrinella]